MAVLAYGAAVAPVSAGGQQRRINPHPQAGGLRLLLESTLEKAFSLRCPNVEPAVKWFHVCGVADHLWDLADGL